MRHYEDEEGRAYLVKTCHCLAASGHESKRRLDKVRELAVRFDSDGKAWIDF